VGVHALMSDIPPRKGWERGANGAVPYLREGEEAAALAHEHAGSGEGGQGCEDLESG
jgi:hypothetical protein